MTGSGVVRCELIVDSAFLQIAMLVAGVLERIVAGLFDRGRASSFARGKCWKIRWTSIVRFSVVETTVAKGVQRVQVHVIETVEQICSREGIEVGEIADHAGGGIDRAAEGDFDGVVVAVAIGVIALAVDGAILLRGVGVGVQAMRGAEKW